MKAKNNGGPSTVICGKLDKTSDVADSSINDDLLFPVAEK